MPESPVSPDQFRKDAARIPNTIVRVERMPELLARFCRRPPAPGYEVKKAEPFSRDDFSIPFLNGKELAQLNRFKVLKKQVEWACGRFAVKSLAREILTPETALTDIRIQYRPQGAPFLKGFESYSLTLSHSGEMTAAALATLPEVVLGIDIEAVGPMPDAPFMKTAFTQREILSQAPTPADVFRCWTLKEAYLKFIGKGFHESLHHVEILGREILHHKEAQPVTARSWLLDSGYAISLVAAKNSGLCETNGRNHV